MISKFIVEMLLLGLNISSAPWPIHRTRSWLRPISEMRPNIQQSQSTFNASPFVSCPRYTKGLYFLSVCRLMPVKCFWVLVRFACWMLQGKGYCKLIAIIIYKIDAISILYGYLIFPLDPMERKKI